tara:strand:- start:171 stop:557 length:387 start_codon:yes stop_codon:yes gene_type:complete
MNAGYDDVKELVMYVMGLNDWLQDREPVEPDAKNNSLGGMNFTINWLDHTKSRYCIRLNTDNTYDMQIFQYQNYKQLGLAIERSLPRESILMLLSTTYQEITSQSNQVLDNLKFEISKETQEILKKQN